MVIQNYRDIRSRASSVLDFTPWDIKKTAFVFAAVPTAITIILSAIDLLLGSLSTAGGLAGLQDYRLLSTVSSTLWMAAQIFSLLWTPGILYCGLMVLRQQDPYPQGLLRGFRKWPALLRYFVLIFLYVIVISFALLMAVSFIATPFMMSALSSLGELPQTQSEMLEYMETVPAAQMDKIMLPVVTVFSVLLFGILLVLSYRVMPGQWLILDEERIGARQALRFSFQLTKGSCWQLFRLDLSFWWYYLLLALALCIPQLEFLPIFRSWNYNVTYFVLNVAQSVAVFGVYILGIMKLNVAKAVAYDHLRTAIQTDAPQLPEETHG